MCRWMKSTSTGTTCWNVSSAFSIWARSTSKSAPRPTSPTPLGFYPMGQETYLAIVRHLSHRRQLQISPRNLEAEAVRWALARGARSGRVARQFIDDLNGRLALLDQERRSGN